MICKDMNGSLCAESHCAYWDDEECDCTLALIAKRNLQKMRDEEEVIALNEIKEIERESVKDLDSSNSKFLH